MEKKALYNSLRMHHLKDPEGEVQEWQIADYRALSVEELFAGLEAIGIPLEKSSFMAFAEACESPEELSARLAEELELSGEDEDRMFLYLFELWRRFMPQKQTMSLFADELDTQIFLYDQGIQEDTDQLETALANLQYLLTEQMDAGEDPQAVFQSILDCSANDLESFLYDFISDQIDLDNILYASELVEGLQGFVQEPKWFALLKVRILLATDPQEAGKLIAQLLELTTEDSDVEYHLEFLAILVQDGDKRSFTRELMAVLPLIHSEEDFQDLLQLCEEYLHCLDLEEKRVLVQELLESRPEDVESKFDPKDPALKKLQSIFQ
ncbi:MAG: hypothetical protein KDK48_06640 [Chlamydiia bacterium]|nr:hypothetical protein [Chlamydiia bacterium]